MTNKQLKISNLKLPTLMDLALPGVVKQLLKELCSGDTEIYLIGGFVRDMILGKVSSDLDFVLVDKDVLEFCKRIAGKFGGNSFLLDEVTRTTRIVLKDESAKFYTFDFTPTLKSDLDADFERRDFTINSLAINLKEQDVMIDKFSGVNDLKERRIKSVKVNNLFDDPIRFVRAFRFAALLDGTVDKETFNFIRDNLNCFNKSVSSERISLELWKILDMHNSYEYIRQMADIGLLEKIFPEISEMKKVPPNDYHHLWLFDHSIELIKTFEENFYKIPSWAKDELISSFGALESPSKQAVTKLACLLHDIGKPQTWEIKNINGKEKHTFYGHDKLGAKFTRQIGERLKFSNSIIDTLCNLVVYHLRPFQLSQNYAQITDRALYRFFRDVGEDLPLLLMLAIADLYATVGPKVTKDDLLKGEELVLYLFDRYKKHKSQEVEKLIKPKLLDGNEIMKLTGLKPSPKLGIIVKDLDEAIAIGEVKTKEEAKSWVLKQLK